MADPTGMTSERNLENRNRWKIPRAAGAVVLAVALAAASAGTAWAAAAHPTQSGGCSGGGTWRLTVRANTAGGLTVKFAESGGAAGDSWNIFMDHDGYGFFSGSRVANGSGAVTVTRKVNNLAGLDQITVSANDNTAGATCTGTASY